MPPGHSFGTLARGSGFFLVQLLITRARILTAAICPLALFDAAAPSF